MTLDAGHVWQVVKDLDAEAMHEAAQALIGKHDFTTFRAAECQAKSPVKSLDRFDITRAGDEIRAIVNARSFLHHQVRIDDRHVGKLRWRRASGSANIVAAALERPKTAPAAAPSRPRTASISCASIIEVGTQETQRRRGLFAISGSRRSTCLSSAWRAKARRGDWS